MRSFFTGASLFAFAWLVRALPAGSVLASDRVYLRGSEAYTHLERIRYALENFPSLPGLDPYVAFPRGAEPPWPILFDALMGIALAPFAHLGGVAALERAAAWAPPLLGAATVVAAWRLARRHFGERVALGAAAFLAVLGGHFLDTQVGAFGPACLLSLLSTLLLAATMSALGSAERRPAVASALVAALCLLIDPAGALYAAAALGALVVAAPFADPAARAGRVRRAALATGVFAAVAGAGFLLLPWSGSLEEAWLGTLGAGVGAYPGVGTGWQPLFLLAGRFDGRVAARSLSYLVYVYPLVWALGLREARQAERRAPLTFFSAWSALLFVATLLQSRFVGVFAVAFAIGGAWSVAAVAGRLRVRGSDASGVVGLVLVLLLLPLRSNYLPHLRNLLGREEGEVPEMSRVDRIERLRYSVAAWLPGATPPTPGWMGGPGAPQYGVFAPRAVGPIIRYVGRRPSMVDGFGATGEGELGLRVWSSPPGEASRMLDDLRARYVVVRTDDRRSSGYSPASLYRALVLRDGGAGPGEGLAVAAPRFRLFYESGRLRSGPRQPPLYRVFELVQGARIEGRAAPGERVDLTLELVSHEVRPLTYRDHTRADDDGRYRFVVPYANVGSSGKVVPAASYRLSCAEDEVSVVVREAQVRRGGRLLAPDLCVD